MKTLRMAVGILALSLVWSLSVFAQGETEVEEKAAEGTPDFAVETLSNPAGTAKQEKKIANSYIVILKEDKHPPFLKSVEKKFDTREQLAAAAEQYEERERRKILNLARAKYKLEESAVQEIFTTGFTGFVATIPDGDARGFMQSARADADVEEFYQDFEVEVDAVFDRIVEPEELRAQTVPWGVGFTRWGNQSVGTRWAFVLDTGIDLDHPDLNVERSTSWARSFVSGQSIDDGHGHGTHVAGTIAARNNSTGVVGVAANTRVVPVKVLSNTGGGSWSGVLSGINWVYGRAWPQDVMNLSLGGGGSVSSIESALRACGWRGIYVTIAAGNSNANANNYTPARTNGVNVYTVSAMDSYCRLASFSNYANPPIDYAAPGVSVLSTYKGGRYAYMSGTSMAAPHMAGLLSLTGGAVRSYGCCNGTVCTDKDSTRDRVARR